MQRSIAITVGFTLSNHSLYFLLVCSLQTEMCVNKSPWTKKILKTPVRICKSSGFRSRAFPPEIPILQPESFRKCDFEVCVLRRFFCCMRCGARRISKPSYLVAFASGSSTTTPQPTSKNFGSHLVNRHGRKAAEPSFHGMNRLPRSLANTQTEWRRRIRWPRRSGRIYRQGPDKHLRGFEAGASVGENLFNAAILTITRALRVKCG